MDAVRRIADCAPGKRVLVDVAGKLSELPVVAKAVEPAGPSVDQIALELLHAVKDRGAIDKQTMALQTLELAVKAMGQSLQSIIEAQTSIAGAIANLATIMGQPVQPMYDAKGVLIGAKRVEKL